MAVPSKPETSKPGVEELLRKLVGVFTSASPITAELLTGAIELVIVNPERTCWTLSATPGVGVALQPGAAKNPVARIGMTRGVLRRWVEGSLDVERAFRDRCLGVDGNLDALAPLLGYANGPQGALAARHLAKRGAR